MHHPIKLLLTLQLVLCALLLAFSRHFYAESMGEFFSFGLASVVVIHLRVRPRWVDAVLIVLMTALIAELNFRVFHYPPTILAWFSIMGLSSLTIVGVRTVWEQGRRLLIYAWGPAVMFILSDRYLARTLHQWTVKAHPRTLDLYLLSFDASLRVQLAFVVGQYSARWLWLHYCVMFGYAALAVPLALVYAGRLIRFREGAFPCMLAFLIAGPVGVLFYNLFPACGPQYVFGKSFPFHPLPIAILSQLALQPAAFPGWRNAIPSLHLTWTLLAWWYSKGLSWVERLVAFTFLAFTVLATLGTGEHWFVDLIVAFPFALMLQAICAYPLPWKDPRRRNGFVLGLGGTLGWMAMLRYGPELFWVSPIIPWALSAATVALVLLRQADLDAGANRGNLAVAIPGVPAMSSLDNAPMAPEQPERNLAPRN